MSVIVTFRNFGSVRLDGVTSGDIESTWANYPELQAEIGAAAIVYMNDVFVDNLGHDEATQCVQRCQALGIEVPQATIDLIPPAE